MCMWRSPDPGHGEQTSSLVAQSFFQANKQANMTSTDQERWQRVKNRLRIELGEDVFSSWFARMELEAVGRRQCALVGADTLSAQLDSVALQRESSRQLAGGRTGRHAHGIDRPLGRHSAASPSSPSTPGQPPGAKPTRHIKRDGRRASVPFMSVHEALGGSPLDPRLSFETFIVGRSNTLAHAAANRWRPAAGANR